MTSVAAVAAIDYQTLLQRLTDHHGVGLVSARGVAMVAQRNGRCDIDDSYYVAYSLGKFAIGLKS